MTGGISFAVWRVRSGSGLVQTQLRSSHRSRPQCFRLSLVLYEHTVSAQVCMCRVRAAMFNLSIRSDGWGQRQEGGRPAGAQCDVYGAHGVQGDWVCGGIVRLCGWMGATWRYLR